LRPPLIRAYRSLESGALAHWQVGAAEAWVKRNQHQREMNLAYALMAVLVLDRYGSRGNQEFAREWRDMARELVQNLGLRALRSSHVEVLSREWLGHTDNRTRTDSLWGRLRQLEGHLRNIPDTPATLQTLRAIERFCRAVEVRHVREPVLQLVADALLMALGRSPCTPRVLINDRHRIVRALMDIYKILPATRSNYIVDLRRSYLDELAGMLAFLSAQALEIILLDPLPTLRPGMKRNALH